jgi:hypothetical protein
MCDSMITGFNNPLKIDFKNPSYKINDSKRSLPLSLLYKNEDK